MFMTTVRISLKTLSFSHASSEVVNYSYEIGTKSCWQKDQRVWIIGVVDFKFYCFKWELCKIKQCIELNKTVIVLIEFHSMTPQQNVALSKEKCN